MVENEPKRESFLTEFGKGMLKVGGEKIGDYLLNAYKKDFKVMVRNSIFMTIDTIGENAKRTVDAVMGLDAKADGYYSPDKTSYQRYNTYSTSGYTGYNRNTTSSVQTSTPAKTTYQKNGTTVWTDGTFIPEERFSSYGQADYYLSELKDCLTRYGQVTVTNYYNIIGKTAPVNLDYLANDFGWMNLDRVQVKSASGGNGYILTLGKVMPLNK